MAILETKNTLDAFYGAMSEIGRAVGRPDFAAKTWDMAMEEIHAETKEETGDQPEYVRAFLDGEWGQAFALCVVSRFPQGVMPNTLTDSQLLESVRKAVSQWQSWPMEPKDYRDLDVPEPMRHLDAMVFSAGITMMRRTPPPPADRESRNTKRHAFTPWAWPFFIPGGVLSA